MTETYQPSGRVNWLRSVIAFVVVLFPIVGLVDAAFRLDRAGWYPPFLGPVVLGSLAAIFAASVVTVGRCRNVGVGRAIGVACTLLAFFGFFQRSLIDARTRGSPDGLRGVPIAELATGLPDYIALRMQNFELPQTGDKQAQAHRYAVGVRWTVFVLEIVALAGIGWWVGGSAAKQPFSERHRVWMTSQRFALPSGTGEGILAWLQGLETLPAKSDGKREVVVLLEHVPNSADEVGYVSIYVGGRDARRELARRRTVEPERLEELRRFLNV
jgi:hypothetical protein